MPVRRLGAGHDLHLTCERAYSGYEIARWTCAKSSVCSKIGSGFFSMTVYHLRSVLICQKSPPSGHSEKKCQSKSWPTGQTDWSNPHPLPKPPPLGVNIYRCITTNKKYIYMFIAHAILQRNYHVQQYYLHQHL
jgi:hypothetical protein